MRLSEALADDVATGRILEGQTRRYCVGLGMPGRLQPKTPRFLYTPSLMCTEIFNKLARQQAILKFQARWSTVVLLN
jgi:hypothetical protein